MKKTIVAATILAMTSGVALAEEYDIVQPNSGAGQVKFEGEVTAASCTITVAGQGSNGTVRLPIINIKEFGEKEEQGKKHKTTPFDIVLSNCTGAAGKEDSLGISWTEAELENSKLGYLKNLATENPASGVSLVIANGDGVDMVPGVHVGTTPQFDDTASRYSVNFTRKDGKDSATLPFTVSYVKNTSDGTVTAGKVESAAIYSVFYK